MRYFYYLGWGKSDAPPQPAPAAATSSVEKAAPEKEKPRFRPALVFLSIASGIGLLVGLASLACLPRGACTALICACACFVSGVVAGFLFGIPKVLQTVSDADGKPTTLRPYLQQVNTNLEQISDWLCKIIVGLGLYELKNIPEYLEVVAQNLADDMGQASFRSFAWGLLVYFTSLGFFCGYLLTRLFLAPEFAEADRSTSLQQDVRNIQEKSLAMDHAILYNDAVALGLFAAETQGVGTDEAIAKLEEVRKIFPERRRPAILLGRLYRKKGDLAKAIDVLASCLAAMKAKEINNAKDRADLLYNRGLYAGLLSSNQAEPRKSELMKQFYEDMTQSVADSRINAEEAKQDSDFFPFLNDARFRAIVGL